MSFSENYFRFGLSALIFHFNEKTKIITQFLGDGTSSPIKKIIGNLIKVKWKNIIDDTRKRTTFNGLELKANFGDFPPFCFCKNETSTNGALADTLTEISSYLNLTLKIQPPFEENYNIWSKKLPNSSYAG